MTENSRILTGLEIAVVGMAGRFPGADTLEAYWENISQGRECIKHFSRDELVALGREETDIDRDDFVPAHGALENIEDFDPDFFSYSAREAALIDPQQRLFLEVAYEALEASGYAKAATDKFVGVFAGASANQYINKHALPAVEADPAAIFQVNYSNQPDFLATRAAYKLGLNGPAMTIQSACSTSLVAIYVACQHLLGGACDLALAGGVSLTLPSEYGYIRQDGMIYARDGRCRPFDAEASGALKGDGAGCVVLKRLEDALEDGDIIDAIILGGAVNNDGAAKAGFTAPGYDGQTEVIRAALAVADIPAETIGYIEAHGTGTPLGDPLEIAALARAYAQYTAKREFAAIGAVKANIGHLDAAAGVAGFIKCALMLRKNLIPPLTNFSRPNPQIDFANSPACIPVSAQPFPATGAPRRTGVSSFGIGGANAHLILEAPPLMRQQAVRPTGEGMPTILPLSAHTEISIQEVEDQIRDLLDGEEKPNIHDLARSLREIRRPLKFRRALILPKQAACEKLRGSPEITYIAKGSANPEGAPPVAFLCTGQGAQYNGMGAELAEREFRQTLDRAIEAARTGAGLDLKAAFSSSSNNGNNSVNGISIDGDINQTALAQPALVAVEIAAAEALRALGVTPQMAMGHSIGEIAAAHIAGLFSFRDAIELAAIRGRLMQSMPPGKMLAIAAAQSDIGDELKDLDIAAINGPAQIVVSGDANAINALALRLTEKEIAHKALATSHAFHSRMMEPIVETFVEEVAKRDFGELRIPMYSSVTGRNISLEEISDPHYWGRNLRQPVRFFDAIRNAMSAERYFYLELGPGDVLTKLARRAGDRAAGFSSAIAGPHDKDKSSAIARAAANLWVCGGAPDLCDYTGGANGPRIRLPAYPFARKKCWLNAKAAPQLSAAEAPCAEESEIGALFLPSWRRLAAARAGTQARPQNWLIISARPEAAERLCAIADGANINSFTALNARRYDFDAKGRATLSLDAAPQIERLALDIDALGRPVDQIIYAAAPNDEQQSSVGDRPKDFDYFINIVRAFSANNRAPHISVNMLTVGAFDVTGAEQLSCWNSALTSLALVAGQEHQFNIVRTIDVSASENMEAEAILAALETDAPRIATRGAYLWRPDIADFPDSTDQHILDQKAHGVEFPDGNYFLIGGDGQIGRAIADRILLNPNCRVAVFSRRGQEASAPRSLRFVGDVRNREDVARAVHAVQTEWGGVDALFHMAGVVGADAVCPLSDVCENEIERQLSAKIDGVHMLAQIPETAPIKKMILFSSLASSLGGLGAGLYSAGNAYLDAFAISRAKAGDKRWTSLACDTLTQQGKGAAENRKYVRLLNSLSEALIEALGSHEPNLAFSIGDLGSRLNRVVSDSAERRPRKAPTTPAASTSSTDDDKSRATARAAGGKEDILNAFRKIFDRDNITYTDNFFELGGDSVICIQLVSKLKKAGFVLTPDLIFEHQTPAAIAQALESKKADKNPPHPTAPPAGRADGELNTIHDV